MQSQMLMDARSYEQEAGKKITPEQRPAFHLVSRCGWMNDPNGFSYADGAYQMYYQYYPYASHWGPMHWGHAKSQDLLHWEYLPCALAPDMQYDKDGCFSGSAATLPDGRVLLMYTGEEKRGQAEFQQQCVAVGDGVDFEKYAGNPVIDRTKLPADASTHHFRDPKILLKKDFAGGDGYYMVAVNQTGDKNGQVLLFSSEDGFQWKFETVLIRGDGRFGQMWECPDFFSLDGKEVFLTSPQDMLPEGYEYHCGDGTLCMVGTLDHETMHFTEEHNQAIDYGIDFYAPQTVQTPDGRRVMIGWMQNWDACSIRDEDAPWAGQMSLPRELFMKDGRLCQRPLQEYEALLEERVSYENEVFAGGAMRELEGVSGRVLDLSLEISPVDEADLYRRFEIRFACDGKHYTALSYEPDEGILRIDRSFSGSRRAILHQQCCQVNGDRRNVQLRLVLDRYSVEVFVNGGDQVMTTAFYTDLSAEGIQMGAFGGAGARADVLACEYTG